MVMVPVAVVPVEAAEAVDVASEPSVSPGRVGRVGGEREPRGDQHEDTQEPHRG